ncbi:MULTISPECIES: hypothetical protein [Rhodococcus]|uniref:hypothetical protein n=1 Tax=Rhodococcus TaxID=1827 RepID=UPI00197F61BF|nr:MULTISPECIES: hypothetical protein [Rhodococcus]MDI9947696.1 hypothetical protein [Rhodococcus sp. IEGM 1305]QSE86420.1 hypothetical protein JWS14_46420 [Rhodococcus koreensis]
MISRTEARTTKQQANEESAVVQSGEGDVRQYKTGAVAGRLRNGDRVIRVRSFIGALVLLAMIGSIGILGWQLHGKTDDLNSMRDNADARSHAEQVALDYSTGAAQMDFRDLASWRSRLTSGTSDELADRLTHAASSMEQIITPLQWVATAKPVAAKVVSENNGSYTVTAFVKVLTTNSQAPDGIDSTASYQLTVDGRDNWKISDIGGDDASLGGAGNPPPSSSSTAPPSVESPPAPAVPPR